MLPCIADGDLRRHLGVHGTVQEFCTLHVEACVPAGGGPATTTRSHWACHLKLISRCQRHVQGLACCGSCHYQ